MHPRTGKPPGDTLRVRPGGPVALRAEVKGCKKTSLRLVWSDGETTLPVTEDAALLRPTVPPLPARRRSYVRAELLRDGAVVALTNPLYLEAR